MLENALYLIPVTLGDTPPEMVLPASVFEIINQLDAFIVENLRSARRFLRKAGFDKDFDTVEFKVLNKHTDAETAAGFISTIEAGNPLGLLSEAGVPCIADPGGEIVRQCHSRNLKVIPLTGPSSIILSLMGSGFNGQNFAFHGYLPIDKSQLKNKLKVLEGDIFKKDQTQIFIETPYRNDKMLAFILSNCSPATALCIAASLTTSDEYIKTMSIAQWKKQKPELNKKPAVFLLYK